MCGSAGTDIDIRIGSDRGGCDDSDDVGDSDVARSESSTKHNCASTTHQQP